MACRGQWQFVATSRTSSFSCVCGGMDPHATGPSAHVVGNTDSCILDVTEGWQYSAIEPGFSFVRLVGSRRVNISYHPADIASSGLLVSEPAGRGALFPTFRVRIS